MAAIELGFGNEIELVYAEVLPTRKNQDYAATYNPLRQVPTLMTADGRAIYDSTVICECLDDMAGGYENVDETAIIGQQKTDPIRGAVVIRPPPRGERCALASLVWRIDETRSQWKMPQRQW